MKKILLLGATALLSTALASAIEPATYDDMQIQRLSPDGKYSYSASFGTFTVINNETGETTVFAGEEYDGYELGLGNCVATDGTVVGTDHDQAAYFKNGEWHILQVPNPEMTNLANAISPDGKTICGSIALKPMSLEDTEVPMQIPVVWNLQSDGTYGEPVLLPHPEKDYTNRVPQYITALAISEDGKTVVGQIRDYSGQMCTVLIYNLGDDGEWTYNNEFQKLANPNNIEIPAFPGDGPMMPSIEQFMSEEDLAAYQQALNDWYNDPDASYSNYPDIEDFISEAGMAAYEEATTAWEEEFAAWEEAYTAFEMAIEECDGTGVLFNNVLTSADCSDIYVTVTKLVEDPFSWFGYSEQMYPATMTLADGEYSVWDEPNVVLSARAADGTLMGFYEDTLTPRKTVIYAPGTTSNPKSLAEFVETYSPESAEYVRENMYHDIDTFDPETYDPVTMPDVDCTGVPCCSPDLSVIATLAENLWDYYGPLVFSYVIPTGIGSGVRGVEVDKALGLTAFKDGRIVVSEAARSIEIVAADGRVVFNGPAAGGVIETGLTGGAYIVTVKGENSSRTIKVIF